MECIQLSLFGRMSPELSALTAEKISAQCWKNLPAWSNQTLQFLDLRGGGEGSVGNEQGQSSETDGVWLGDRLMLNIGESPSAAKESLLSWILQVDAPEKYYLSARACRGILTRASRRGKKLPDLLQTALLEMIEWWEPGASARVMETLIAEEQRRMELEKAKRRKERVVTNAVKQLRTLLKSVRGVPEAARAHLCRQKKLGRYRHSKTKRFSS